MTDEPALTPDQEAAVRQLVALATTHVGRAPDYRLLRGGLRWATRGRFGRNSNSSTPRLGAPWEDTDCTSRTGWRTRAAYVDDTDAPVFAVDYRVCRRCRLGWVWSPATEPNYQRYGLATAAFAALRLERPGVSWHTMGDHLGKDAALFYRAAGRGVSGGYQPRELCSHVKPW